MGHYLLWKWKRVRQKWGLDRLTVRFSGAILPNFSFNICISFAYLVFPKKMVCFLYFSSRFSFVPPWSLFWKFCIELFYFWGRTYFHPSSLSILWLWLICLFGLKMDFLYILELFFLCSTTISLMHSSCLFILGCQIYFLTRFSLF